MLKRKNFLVLLILGAVFLKGFGEAIGVAVVLVVSYILLNLVVIGAGLWQIVQDPGLLAEDHLASVIYRGTVYDHPPAGLPESLAALPRDDLVGFYRSYYTLAGSRDERPANGSRPSSISYMTSAAA